MLRQVSPARVSAHPAAPRPMFGRAAPEGAPELPVVNVSFEDARAYARWGFDYLKYDYCSFKGDLK